MPVKIGELAEALEFASADGGLGDWRAFLCRQTGKIHLQTGDADLDELPDDIEDDEKYIELPSKRDLDLGKPLVLAFARQHLPDDVQDVRDIFSRRGAYARFKTFLMRKNALDLWYGFESEQTERALREWCEENSIVLTD